MRALVQQAIDSFAPITLDELQSRAPLLTRVDNKYIVSWPACASVLETLLDDFRVLEIGARRTFEYETTYFDTHSLTLYRAHVQRRRKRFKCRSRHYVDTGSHFFEMKMKGRRDETIKRQMAYDRADMAAVTADAWQFIRDCLVEQYGQHFDDELALSLSNNYRRMTFVARDGAERLTCDFDLSFAEPSGLSGRLSSDFLVLETKTIRGKGAADRTLKAIGARPLICSKYCVGTALLRPDVKSNELRGVVQRYFQSNAVTAATDAELRCAGGRGVEKPRASAASFGAVRVADQISAVNDSADLGTPPAPGFERRQPRGSRRRLSPTVTWRLSQATTLVVANAAAAYEVCSLTNPPLWLALLAGVSLTRGESELIWSLHHRYQFALHGRTETTLAQLRRSSRSVFR
jgi:hypothetical protein